MTRLCRLLYVSRSLLEGIEPQQLAQLSALVEGSARRNALAGVTGSLLFDQGHFVQVLEGPEDAVERVFEAICCDFRHADVALVDFAHVRERLFGRWSMALLREGVVSPIDASEIPEIRLLTGINGREALRRMRSLLDGLEEERGDQPDLHPTSSRVAA
jgi:hypothetical protein